MKILIAKFLFPLEEEFWDAIRHEYAHAIVYLRDPSKKHGHNAIWKMACLEVGRRPNRTASLFIEPSGITSQINIYLSKNNKYILIFGIFCVILDPKATEEEIALKDPVVSKILRIVLYVIFAAGIIGTVTLPFMLETYTSYLYDAYYPMPGYRRFILVFLMVVAVLGLWVVWELICIMRSVPSDPFVRKNVVSLRRIGFLVMAVAVLFFLKCCYYATFLTMACGFLFILCGLFAFTLCSLFKQALAFKEENDLTI